MRLQHSLPYKVMGSIILVKIPIFAAREIERHLKMGVFKAPNILFAELILERTSVRYVDVESITEPRYVKEGTRRMRVSLASVNGDRSAGG